MPTQENPPSATNAERAEDISAGSVKSASILSQPRPSAAGVDLLTMTDRERECHLSGYLSGVLAGIDIGREQMDNELAAIHRRAYNMVQSMARQPTWEEAQQARRRHQDEAAKSYRRPGQPWPLEVAS
jgi:hypothetical protein